MANLSMYELGPYRLRSSSAFTKKFMGNYVNGMSKFSGKRSEGLAVMAASHKNFYPEKPPSGSFPVDIFNETVASRHQVLIQKCQGMAVKGEVNLKMPVYEPTESGRGRFIRHLNYLRGMRPSGEAKKNDIEIDADYRKSYSGGKESPLMTSDPEEIFLSGSLNGKDYDLFYNLFPFAPFHFLLVPQIKLRVKQYLEYEHLRFAWDFVHRAGDPNLRLAFNSLGAHASVNQLHFQCFYLTEGWKLPIEGTIDSVPADPSGKPIEDWPVKYGYVFKGNENDDSVVLNAYRFINSLCEKAKADPYKIAFNLYVKPGSISIFPRKHQSTYVDYLNNVAKFSTGPAWIELLGIHVIIDEANYNETTEGKILNLYKEISLSEDPFK